MSDSWASRIKGGSGAGFGTRLALDGKTGREIGMMAQAIPIPKGHVDAITAVELMEASGMTPYDWQLELLGIGDHVKRIRLCAASRQAGKTKAVCAFAMQTISQQVGRFGVLLPSKSQAVDNLLVIRSYYFEALDKGFTDRMPVLLNDDNERPERLRFSNGSVIQALSGVAGNLRTGRGANNRGGPMIGLWVDEASFVLREAFIAVYPTLASTRGPAIITSTVWTDFGWFWDTLNGKGDLARRSTVIRKTADDIPHIDAEHLADARAIMSDAEFMREYYLVPTPLVGGLIPGWALALLGRQVEETDPLSGFEPDWKPADNGLLLPGDMLVRN